MSATAIPCRTPRRQRTWNKTGGRCYYCGVQLIGDPFGRVPRPLSWMNIDHAHPKALGGGDRLANRLPACTACNCSKGKLTPHEYRRRLMRQRGEIVLFYGEVCA